MIGEGDSRSYLPAEYELQAALSNALSTARISACSAWSRGGTPGPRLPPGVTALDASYARYVLAALGSFAHPSLPIRLPSCDAVWPYMAACRASSTMARPKAVNELGGPSV